MDALRPSHSLPTRASGLYESYPSTRPPQEAREIVDTQTDMIPGPCIPLSKL